MHPFQTFEIEYSNNADAVNAVEILQNASDDPKDLITLIESTGINVDEIQIDEVTTESRQVIMFVNDGNLDPNSSTKSTDNILFKSLLVMVLSTVITLLLI